MVSRVVADFEAVTVQFGDLLPREVVVLVRAEGESFGDEEGRAEPVFLQQRADDGVVAGLRVVEGQHDQLVGNGLWTQRTAAEGPTNSARRPSRASPSARRCVIRMVHPAFLPDQSHSSIERFADRPRS